MLFHQTEHSPNLDPTETDAVFEADISKPHLGSIVPLLDVDMWRLVAICRIEEKPVGANAEDGRNIGPSPQPSPRGRGGSAPDPSLHLRRGVEDGLDDVLVAGAATEVAGDEVAHLGLGGIGDLAQEVEADMSMPGVQ